MKLAAIAAFAIVGLAVAQTVRPIPIREVQLVGEVPAEWWTYVELKTAADGTPVQSFSVPHDRYFVVNVCLSPFGISADGSSVTEELQILNAAYYIGGSNSARVAFPPGALIKVTPPPNVVGQAQLWGYLEPVR
jgi:hypothetical protein